MEGRGVMLRCMNRHDLANLEQQALLREALDAEPAQPEDISESDRPTSEPATPYGPDAGAGPLSPGRPGLMGN